MCLSKTVRIGMMLQRLQGNDIGDWWSYKQARNNVTRELRNARLQFEQKLTTDIKKNQKTFFSYVRSKSRTKDRVGPLKDNNGQVVDDDQKSCDILNSFFSSVYTDENMNNMPEAKQMFYGSECNKLSNIYLDKNIVLKKIMNLKEGKAPGDDGYNAELLKNIANEICEPLSYIFNRSIVQGIVPLSWRQANVTPLFKKGTKQDPGNYRPVSLTSQICKLLESIIKDNIINHLNTNNLINSSQHGFTERKSCLTNLLEFLDSVTNYVDQGHPVDVIYLYLQKAFDKVPHERLLLKLKAHGITGEIAIWIRAWLRDRQQRVILNNEKSDYRAVKSGVPQGSILDPLLFLVYINDLDEGILSKVLKFADDTKLVAKIASNEDIAKLRHDLETLGAYADGHRI